LQQEQKMLVEISNPRQTVESYYCCYEDFMRYELFLKDVIRQTKS